MVRIALDNRRDACLRDACLRNARRKSGFAPRALLALTGFAVAFIVSPARAEDKPPAEEIGKAETIENRVTGDGQGQSRALAVPDGVFRDETIRTEDKAQAKLRFRDESDLRLGPKAAIRLDAFVFSGKKEAALELASGAMRFASGNGPKGSYLIRTPVATIGLRGTVVEVTVQGGRTWVSLHEGAAEVCTRSGRCMELRDACTFLSVDNRGVTLPQPLSRRMPAYSTQCTGDFCVQDACSPRFSGAPGATPPAATPPRNAAPPRVKTPQQKPPRPRRRLVEEEIIIDERDTRPPYGGGIYLPNLPVYPGIIRPDRPDRPGRWPGGRYPETRPQNPSRLPIIQYNPGRVTPGFNGGNRGGGFYIR